MATVYGVSLFYPDNPHELIDWFKREVSPPYVVPFEPLPIKELSDRMQVYIYNAGPFKQVIEMGSLGALRLDGISVEEFINRGVSSPAVIPGLPSEVYPPEFHGGMGVRQYYQPSVGFEGNPGLGMAMEVTRDLDRVGVFVSTTRDHGSEEWRLAFDKAHGSVVSSAVDACGNYDKRHAENKHPVVVGLDGLLMAKIAGRDPQSCPWLQIAKK